MPNPKRVIRRIRPARTAFDEQFWPVMLAMFLLGGFLAGTVSAYLSVDDPRWYANAWNVCLFIAVAICVAISWLRSIEHRRLRRGIQLSVVLGLFVHLLLFVVLRETDVFRRYWEQDEFIAESETDALIEPDYQDFQFSSEAKAPPLFEQPVEAETPDPQQPKERRTEQEPTPVDPTPTATAEVEPVPRSNLPERRELAETVPRYSDQPSSRKRNLAESQAVLTEAATQAADTPRAEPLTDQTELLQRAAVASAGTPQSTDVATPEPTRAQPRPDRRQRLEAPHTPTPQTILERELTEREPQAARTEAFARAPTEQPTPPMLQPSQQLRIDRAEASAEVAPQVAETPATTPSFIANGSRPRRTNEATPQLTELATQPSRRPSPVQPASPQTAELAERSGVEAAQTADVEPAQLAVTRSLSGSAGVGQTDNVETATGIATSPTTVASARARESRTTQQDEPGPSIAPSMQARVRRDRGAALQPAASLQANDASASRAGAAQPEDMVRSAAATLERQQANAARAPDVAAEGTSEIELGPPRVIGRSGSARPGGGGQPEVQLTQQLAQSSRGQAAAGAPRRRAVSGPYAVVNAAAETPAGPSVELGDGVKLAAATSDQQRAPSSGSMIEGTLAGSTTEEPTVTETGSARSGSRRPLEIENPGELSGGGTLARSDRSTRFTDRVRSPTTDLVAALADTEGNRGSDPGTRVTASDIQPRRRAGGMSGPALEANLEVGPSGLTLSELREAGVRSRRASRESEILQMPSARFPRREAGGPPTAPTRIFPPAAPFARRSERLLNPSGGAGPETDAAIESGLAFLARYQMADGRWSLQSVDDGEAVLESDTAATSLALLCFLGAGYHHREHQYAEVVEKGLRFLQSHQKSDGDLYLPSDNESSRAVWLYSHAIAALAICEAYGMTQDPELRSNAQRAVDFVALSQDQDAGGWRYTPGYSSDTSVTGWMWMALKSADLAKLEVPPATFSRARKWLDTAQDADERHLYRYNPFAPDTPAQAHGRVPSQTMTAVGLLLRVYDRVPLTDPLVQRGARHLLDELPSASAPDTYYWYYATQFLFQVGGEAWETWNASLQPLLIDSQLDSGEYAGSWNALSPVADRWGPHAGRIYVTTLNVLSLEVRYRHLPLYE